MGLPYLPDLGRPLPCLGSGSGGIGLSRAMWIPGHQRSSQSGRFSMKRRSISARSSANRFPSELPDGICSRRHVTLPYHNLFSRAWWRLWR